MGKFYNTDPESQDVLDQDDGLDGGSEGGSYFWIYVLVGVILIGGIVVLVFCLTGGKKSKSKKYTFKDVPATGELKPEETQLFVKELYDFSQEIKLPAAALKQKVLDAAKITDPKERADALTRALAESETVIDKELDLIQQAGPYAERINPDKQQEINGVKSVQEAVKNFLKLGKEALEADRAVIETERKLLEATTTIKDPSNPTEEEKKAITDLTAQAATEKDQAVSKGQAVSQVEVDIIKKLFPAEKSTDKNAKPNDSEDAKPKTQ